MFLIGLQLALLGGAVAAAALTSRQSDWEPAILVFLLAGLAVISDALTIETRGLRLSGSFLALVLAMAFLGPAPAVAIALLTIGIDAVRSRPRWVGAISNFATYAAFPLLGGLIVRHAGVDPESFTFGFVVLGVYCVTIGANFALTAFGLWSFYDASPRRLVRDVLVPILPSELVAAMLVLAFSWAYISAGLTALGVLILALIAFQYLTRALLVSQERAEQLEARTKELASLQVGVLAAMVQTLSLRDKMTARHSAAVARYSRAIARAIGCSEDQQALVHTAGLLHDIGKFIFPDRILFADRKLSEEDWQIVKRHPAQGARVVGKVAGYGPVAEIIRCHHERIDGKGYPRGLRGDEIPLLSRMISIADTYDVMTARDSYRDPVSQEEAIAELRRVSGTQLDGELVEVFIALLKGSGVGFQHTTDADFEAELDIEARVRAFVS
ncbi:MAG TPA: HD domain-containing phosphohydrolase [Capillimicrobium sp.]|nr:HD domain-containing phosphohydrolase [Capillimicrobium sp.]